MEKIYEDPSQTLWFVGGFGVSSMDSKRGSLTNHNALLSSLESLQVLNMLYIDEHQYWLGMWLHGLVKITDNTPVILTQDTSNPGAISGNNITAMLQDHKNNIWIGTDNNGLNRLNEGKRPFIHYRHDVTNAQSLGSDRVNVIFQSNDDTIWVGTDAGISLFNRRQNLFINL